jgi:hypothetical protein
MFLLQLLRVVHEILINFWSVTFNFKLVTDSDVQLEYTINDIITN